jgi:hypothetical protein
MIRILGTKPAVYRIRTLCVTLASLLIAFTCSLPDSGSRAIIRVFQVENVSVGSFSSLTESVGV